MRVAQLVEQRSPKPQVVESKPTAYATACVRYNLKGKIAMNTQPKKRIEEENTQRVIGRAVRLGYIIVSIRINGDDARVQVMPSPLAPLHARTHLRCSDRRMGNSDHCLRCPQRRRNPEDSRRLPARRCHGERAALPGCQQRHRLPRHRLKASRLASWKSSPRASRRVTWCRARHRVRLCATTFSYEAAPGNAFRERNMAKEYAAVQPATRPPATAQ